MATVGASVVPAEKTDSLKGARLVAGYVAVGAFLAAAIATSIGIGHGRHAEPSVAGFYSSSSACLGKSFKLDQSGQFVDLSGGPSGKLRLRSGHLTGNAHCLTGGTAALNLAVAGQTLTGQIGGSAVTAKFTAPLPAPGSSAKPPPKRTSEQTFGRLMIAIAAVLLAARLVGAITSPSRPAARHGRGARRHPPRADAARRRLARGARTTSSRRTSCRCLSGAAQIGLAFYLFLVGMELDPRALRGKVGQAAFISNTSVAFPMGLGFLIALPIYKLLSPNVRYLPFALFMGVAMSITAFPVLARILIERRMLKKPVGALALGERGDRRRDRVGPPGARDGRRRHRQRNPRDPGDRARRRVHGCCSSSSGGRCSAASRRPTTRSGRCRCSGSGSSSSQCSLSAFTAQQIGIAAIFGAFLLGLIMPRRAGLTADVSAKFENFVVLVLLPLFFVVTGLKTQVNALNRPILWVLTLVLIAVAIVGKFFGAMLAARYGRFSLRDSVAIGTLMNTRGLTELIVLNIGLDLGVISHQLFTMLVVMALVTTFMAGPILQLVDPRQRALRAGRGRAAPGAARDRRDEGADEVDPRRAAGSRANLDALLATRGAAREVGARRARSSSPS